MVWPNCDDNKMKQDSGITELDRRRKARGSDGSEWDVVSEPRTPPLRRRCLKPRGADSWSPRTSSS